ncbi:hypothetical protein DUI87_00310 [Hirundo rustica rustica]|uniref:Dynein regulatory complex protein 1/2 N-terminal domain-containing protein n=1 Tax=Hirundo rustica rustica TaxID=333673 RepID=A0A3M0LAZ6_HIRRU|nr:hypothetical protein DUI87_00310 [Hirundo rustica rustica]
MPVPIPVPVPILLPVPIPVPPPMLIPVLIPVPVPNPVSIPVPVPVPVSIPVPVPVPGSPWREGGAGRGGESGGRGEKSLELIQETGKALAKLLFHGTQLVTDVRVEADLRESRRREKEGPERRRRLEKLEAEAKRGTEKLAEINSRWALAGEAKIPQELWDLVEQQQDQCQQLLARKNRLIRELQQELAAKDERYEQALKDQAEEIRLLLERMEEQTRNMLRTYRHHIRRIEVPNSQEKKKKKNSEKPGKPLGFSFSLGVAALG